MYLLLFLKPLRQKLKMMSHGNFLWSQRFSSRFQMTSREREKIIISSVRRGGGYYIYIFKHIK